MGKREKIVSEAQALAVDGQLNLTEVRREHKSLYAKIAQVFDSVDEFKEAMKPVECVYAKYRRQPKARSDKHFPAIDLSLRNLLALERMIELRLNYPLERIALQYNVSKQAVHQLEEALREAHKHSIDVSTFEIYNQNTTN